MNKAEKAGVLYRAFYYLRTGYKLYLAFPLTLTNTLVILYYYLIRGTRFFWLAQHKFLAFSIVGLGIIVPIAAFFGWVHMKRIPGYAAEADLQVESNPYMFKLAPGLWREIYARAWLAFAKANKHLLIEEGLLTEHDERVLYNIIEQTERLRRGESVGIRKDS